MNNYFVYIISKNDWTNIYTRPNWKSLKNVDSFTIHIIWSFIHQKSASDGCWNIHWNSQHKPSIQIGISSSKKNKSKKYVEPLSPIIQLLVWKLLEKRRTSVGRCPRMAIGPDTGKRLKRKQEMFPFLFFWRFFSNIGFFHFDFFKILKLKVIYWF